jgi:hypothetical protein
MSAAALPVTLVPGVPVHDAQVRALLDDLRQRFPEGLAPRAMIRIPAGWVPGLVRLVEDLALLGTHRRRKPPTIDSVSHAGPDVIVAILHPAAVVVDRVQAYQEACQHTCHYCAAVGSPHTVAGEPVVACAICAYLVEALPSDA